MIHKQSRQAAREKRHHNMRRTLSGTALRPRLAVFRSNKHIYAQVIDDVAGSTLAAASTMDKALVQTAGLETTSDVTAAKAVGGAVAQKLLEKGIDTVVFDRGGYIYHGKVRALADAAREVGLKF